MKPHLEPTRCRRGFTLLEMSIVIMMLIALVSIGVMSSSKIEEWKLARAASESLRSVHTAQRMFLADNPTFPVANLTPALLLPYMPNGTAIPTVKTKAGTSLSISVGRFPPVIDAGGGTVYDPSGSSEDSLWDVGK
ncbi:MAG: type II secretion system protein [Verrucomicrobiota bacterium]